MNEMSPSDADALLAEVMFTPEGRADPYTRYAALHRGAPAFRSAIDALVVCGYDDCQQSLRDGRLGKDEASRRARARRAPADADDALLAEFQRYSEQQRSMLFLNPPDHTRLRKLVSKAFTPRTVEAMRPHILRLTDELLDGFGGGAVEVMDALAFPLPVTVIGEMLGVPVGDRPPFQSLVRASTAALEPTLTGDAMRRAIDASEQMREYFAGLVSERRARPQDDLLSSLIAAEDEGDHLDEEELISTAILLLAAGFETTTNLIGNGLHALLDHPDQLQRLRDDPSLARSAVEELLRWDSPVQIAIRVALEDTDLAGHDLPAGSQVLVLVGAANHDPARYHEPERLDLARDEGPPMSFGSGIHFCLGAALARVEGQIVFTRLLERFPKIALSGPAPVYRESVTLRGLVDLRVDVQP
jgi:cytochrome P450